MTLATDQLMLTLAGVAYRGFQDPLPGPPHDDLVRLGVSEGLRTLSPVSAWKLVWGPVTGRGPRGGLDSNAMFVVQHRMAPHRLVVAIRGTNPIALSDWLFGDLLVGRTVSWPYATDGSAISASTAVGLDMLQSMRAAPPSAVGRLAEAAARAIEPLGPLVGAGRASVASTVAGMGAAAAGPAAVLERQIASVVDHWNLTPPSLDELQRQFERAAANVRLGGASLRPTLLPTGSQGDGLDLLTFLRSQADRSAEPLEVSVTGHSKGGALAPTVALWLRDALDSEVAGECWDTSRRATVACHAFAGPTPGNTAFARRLEQKLGANQRYVRNRNDVVAQAWQVSDLRRIPSLYGGVASVFGPLVRRIIQGVEPLDYHHAQVGVEAFDGQLTGKPLAAEMIHHHLAAYLDHFGLGQQGITALTFFV